MKIGIDARMYSTGFTGIGRYTAELLINLLKIDQKNQYVAFFSPQGIGHCSLAASNLKKVSVAAPHYSLQEQTTLVDALLKEKLDLMHFTHFNAPLLYRQPCVVTIHDLTLSFYEGKKRTSWLERTAYNFVIRNIVRQAKKIIAVSKYTKEDLEKLFTVPSEKISVIYEGVGSEFGKIEDQTRLQVTRKKYALERPFLLYTGVWRDHKNVTGLIRAMQILVQDHNQDIDLVITGKPDPHYPEVQTLPKELGIAEHVKLVGFVDEVELVNLYNLARVFVFPSLYEGFGLPMLESMACGTPVAASNRSSLPEVGADAALYFDPENTTEMANTILKLLQEEQLRTELITKGYERVQQFSWEKMARETLAMYESLSHSSNT